MNVLLEKENSETGFTAVPYCSFHVYNYEKNPQPSVKAFLFVHVGQQ